jgi:hypothetical protein
MSEHIEPKSKTMKIPGPDHPISVERNASRVGRWAAVLWPIRGRRSAREATLLSNHPLAVSFGFRHFALAPVILTAHLSAILAAFNYFDFVERESSIRRQIASVPL